jgi:hypothetical protein
LGSLSHFTFSSYGHFQNKNVQETQWNLIASRIYQNIQGAKNKMMMQVSLPKKDKNKTKKEANKESLQFHRVPMTYAL